MHNQKRFNEYALLLKGSEPLWKTILGGCLIFAIFYFVVGFVSLMEASDGANIAYMPFWHAPWKLILQLFM